MPRLPAEWEPQRQVMLTWPREDGDFADSYAAVESCFIAIAEAIAPQADLLLSFDRPEQRDRVTSRLEPLFTRNRLTTFVVANNDVWARDHGPIGVSTASGIRLLNFVFDGWGGKHAAALDNQINTSLRLQDAFAGLPMDDIELTLEGGALETDGEGTLMATVSSVLDPCRNAGMNRELMQERLHRHLGVQRFFWLQHGALIGDDTDGHIDTLARFVAPDTIVFQSSGGKNDPNHAELSAMEQELRALRRASGEAYRLIALPWAGEHRSDDGHLLPATYANFLFLNSAILLPIYRTASDQQAIDVLTRACPKHQILPVDCRALIRQYGSLHCVTMNIPA